MREEFPLHDNEASSFFSNMTREMKKLLCETVVEKKKKFRIDRKRCFTDRRCVIPPMRINDALDE